MDMFDKCKPRIVNVVATGRFPSEVDIVGVYNNIDFPVKEYEPDQYPALLVKIEVGNNLRHVTIYKNGKYIITGAISINEVNEIYEKIFNILQESNYI